MNCMCCHACKNYIMFCLCLVCLCFTWKFYLKLVRKSLFQYSFLIMPNISCGKSLMMGMCGFVHSFLKYKWSCTTFLISTQQAAIQISLQNVVKVCSLRMWIFFLWHCFTSKFAIGWDLQIIIWLLELSKSGLFILPLTHIKSFFTIGVSVKSELVWGKDWPAVSIF